MLTGVQIKPSATTSHISFFLNKKTFGRVKYLPGKETITVQFANTKKQFHIQNAKIGGSNIVSISTKSTKKNDLMFIIKVKDRVKWKINFIQKDSKGRTVLELDITSKQAKTSKPSKVRAFFKKLEKKPKPVAKAKAPSIITIVIDAGHGGKDSGALGLRGKKEKDVVLAISKRLASLINKTPGMRAVMTRKGDYYVPLRSRLKLARKGDADLFVAVHADAFFNNKARGVSVYALSHRGATSEAARWLARKDKYVELDDIELNRLKDRSMVLRSVLIDMAQTATIRESLLLGNKLLNALDDISLLHSKRVEQAPFVVLKSPDIPSVLIETGFITNPYEEKRLSDPHYQQKVASAIYSGIKKYYR